MKALERWKFYASFFLVLIVFAIGICFMEESLLEKTIPYGLSVTDCKSEKFREQNISEANLQILQKFSLENQLEFSKVIAVAMVSHNFDLNTIDISNYSVKEYRSVLKCLESRGGESFENLLVNYNKIWNDIQYFPVPESTCNNEAGVTFSDSWMHERSFGGKRGHEGTDIMADINKRGYYPIISMSNGVVEKIGWLTQGGYRIGIRSKSGTYFYYAHLYRYAKDYQPGDIIKAGDMIGYMGDSGYGEEGTIGKFDVHLHVGIYIQDEKGEEFSVNSFPVLKYIEENKLKFSY